MTFRKGHAPSGRALSRNTAASFWARVSVTEDGCWEWLGTRHPKGYGSMCWRGRTKRAHRLAWELGVGPIPVGQHVLHRCDNPPCCNPAHLFLGTNAENVADRERKHRRVAPRGSQHPRSKLTEAAVIAIREAHAAGARNVDIAAQYGLHPESIYSIVHRRSWRHV